MNHVGSQLVGVSFGSEPVIDEDWHLDSAFQMYLRPCFANMALLNFESKQLRTAPRNRPFCHDRGAMHPA